jgi:hypothetical protein
VFVSVRKVTDFMDRHYIQYKKYFVNTFFINFQKNSGAISPDVPALWTAPMRQFQRFGGTDRVGISKKCFVHCLLVIIGLLNGSLIYAVLYCGPVPAL